MEAAAFGHQVQDFGVVAHVGGGQAAVDQLQGDEPRHDLQGVAAVGHEVVVHEIDEVAPGEAPDFLDFVNHFVHRAVPEFAAVNLGHFAVVAGKGAAPGGLGGDVQELVALEVQQVVAGHRQVFQIGEALAAIARLHPPGLEIPQQLRPGRFGLAQDQGVGVFLAFVRGQGGVEAAHDHGNPPPAEPRGQLIGPGGLVGHEGQGHQVAVLPEGDLFQQVILDLHPDVGGRQGRQVGKGHAQEPALFASIQAAVAVAGRLDQQDFHDV